MGCPLCGELTHKASTRLIRDTCGHVKCRLCLLKEENGCRLCEAQPRIDSIGSFDYPIPTSKSTNYEFSNCQPLQLTINKIPVNLEINDLSQSIQKEMTVDENNVQSQNNDIPTECNENVQQNELNKTAGIQSIDKQNASTPPLPNLVENINPNGNGDFHHLNSSRALVTSGETEGNTEDAQNKQSDNQNNLENNYGSSENQIVYQITYPVSSCSMENSNQIANSKVETTSRSHCGIPVLQKNLASIESPSKLEELEKMNSDLPNKTPTHLNNTSPEARPLDSVGSPFKSPAFRLSDYLTFNKRNEKDDGSPLPVNYKSPAFRLSDYILFKDRSSEDELLQRLDREFSQEERRSGNYITSDGFLVQRIADDSQNPMMGIEDDFQNNYINETNTATDNSSPVLDTSYPILKKKIKSYSDTSNPKQSQSATCDLKGTNSSLLKQAKIKNGKAEDDEDKENKKLKKKEKAVKKSTKVKSDVRNVAWKKVTFPTKNKSKNVNRLKIDSKKRQRKEKELDEEPIATRKGERTRKRKVLMYENEVLEVVTKKRSYQSSSLKKRESPKLSETPKLSASPKRRRGRKPLDREKDWSHVIRLPGSPARYSCTVCNASFGHWRGRTAHAACRIGLPPFHCNVCDRSFYKRTHYEYHERTHTGEKPHACHLCGKSFVQKNKLNRHLIVHKQQNEIECDICGKKYNSKDYLKNHLISHQQHVFKCSICPKTFSLDANRKRHELSHTTEKPFTCDICSKSFKSMFLMTRHKRLHSKVRPYKCDHCKHSFISKCAIQRHMSKHIDLPPLVCEICNAKFRRKDNLKRHVLHHHSQDVVVENALTRDSIIENKDQQLHASGPSTPEVVVPTTKRKKVAAVQANKIEQKGNKPRKVKKTTKPKIVSRTKSRTNNKNPSKSSKINVSSSVVPITVRPPTTKFGFVEDIPREEVLLLNQEIEMKMRASKSFCNFPGLSRIDLRTRGDSMKSNSNSNDATANNPKQEIENTDNWNDENPISSFYIHWRRRTAETLMSNSKKKS